MHNLTITLSLDEIAALDRSIRHSIKAHLGGQELARRRIHEAIEYGDEPDYTYETSLKRHAADIASLRRVQAALNNAQYSKRRNRT